MDSISVVHQLAGYASPTTDAAVQAVWKGIRRTQGTAPAKKKAARTKVIGTLVAPLGTSLGDVRDRALLLIGFAGALRRSELVALDVADISEDEEGLIVRLHRCKVDQDGRGETRGLPYGSRPATCPVRAWRAWLAASGITDGAAFRPVSRHGLLSSTRLSDRAVADMIKRRAQQVGLAGDFAGHSLRAGFATEAYAQGTSELAIMRHGRWRSGLSDARLRRGRRCLERQRCSTARVVTSRHCAGNHVPHDPRVRYETFDRRRWPSPLDLNCANSRPGCHQRRNGVATLGVR
jgi:integrase